ncbi:MAG TPA: hypothetical protein VHW96_13685 [Solirubrobacteraceae bacterium]|jgi:hypothetical protein|nr:hypothetical protein [Solirubrobacteraceae bacterium]
MSRAAELLRSHAEVMKLARLLDREPDQLAYLERLAPADLRALRDGVTETLYDANGSSLGRLAAASRLLPSGLTATLGQRAFGPLLSARLAGLLDTDKAVDVATKLPPPFLADVAAELDPRRASDLIASIAPALIGQVTAELVARREYVTMGRFVGHLGDDAIAAAVAAMDDEAVLQVAFVLEDKSQLSRLFAKLPKGRSAGIIAAAADEGLWLEALDLLNHLHKRQRKEMVLAALGLEAPAVEAILDTIIAHDLTDEVRLIAEHDDSIEGRLAERRRQKP